MPEKIKNKFRKASMREKVDMFKEYQINPRNTSSSSYAVPGISEKMLSYYNLMPDKWKKAVLRQPVNERDEFVKYINELEANAK